MKRIRYIFMMAAIMAISIGLLTSCSKNDKYSVEVDITFGYDGTLKVAADNPLKAVITNNGAAFKGELQIEIENNTYGIMIVATPFEIAENAQKEIEMDVPVNIIQKKFDVRIVSGKDTVYSNKIAATNLLSPNKNVMAVISDTPDTYRFLETAKVAKLINPYDNYYYPVNPVDDVYSFNGEEAKVLYFDSFDDFNTVEKLDFFNYIYIGHNQSLNIDEQTENALLDWISKGNYLIVETGTDYLKAESFLPESLKPFVISGTKKVTFEEGNKITLDEAIDLAILRDISEDTIFFDDGDNHIAAKTPIGSGGIITLLVNMGLEPIASWNGKSTLLTDVFSKLTSVKSSVWKDYYNDFSYMLYDIPTDKEPPYLFMIILFSTYILVVGPILYFILKKLDKRDSAWFIMPSMAVVCIIILFAVGSKTRFKNPIINSISVITAHEDEDFMTVSSKIALFNDQKDTMSISWGKDENFKPRMEADDYYMYYTYDDMYDNEKTLQGKLTLGSEKTLAMYDVGIWEPSFASSVKTLPFSCEKLMSIEVNNDKVVINVRNSTPFEIKYAFVQWANGNIAVGDLAPGEERIIETDINKIYGSSSETFFENLLDYTRSYVFYPRPKEDAEKRWLYELLTSFYVYNYGYYGYNPYPKNIASDLHSIKLCGVNTQPIGFDIKVNGKELEDYSTNIIEIEGTVEFAEGSIIQIPPSMMTPDVTYYLDREMTTAGSFELQSYDNYIRFYEKGVAELHFKVPDGIEMNSASITIFDLIRENDYYNVGVGGKVTPYEEVIYMVYNPKTEEYEDITNKLDNRVFNISKDYVDERGNINFRIDFLSINENGENGYSYCQMMMAPELIIEGRVE